MDLMLTLCDLAGIDLSEIISVLMQTSKTEENPTLQLLDGRSVADLVLGKVESLPEREILYWHGMRKPQAIRKGVWKLFFDYKQPLQISVSLVLCLTGKEKVFKASAKRQRPVLFNLAEQQDELVGYSLERPDIVKLLSDAATRKFSDTRKILVPLWQPSK